MSVYIIYYINIKCICINVYLDVDPSDLSIYLIFLQCTII